MKRVITIAAAAIFASTVASFAGGLAPAVGNPVVVSNVAMYDWSGAYAGLSAGRVNGAGVNENAVGVFAGYRFDLGTVVLGSEVDYRRVNKTDAVALKATMGVDAGQFMPYATVGYGKAAGVESAVYGVGLEVQTGSNISIGAEYLRTDVSKLDAFALRTSYRF